MTADPLSAARAALARWDRSARRAKGAERTVDQLAARAFLWSALAEHDRLAAEIATARAVIAEHYAISDDETLPALVLLPIEDAAAEHDRYEARGQAIDLAEQERDAYRALLARVSEAWESISPDMRFFGRVEDWPKEDEHDAAHAAITAALAASPQEKP